jgi:uncharacterized damage-inducible protein DinB
MEHPLSYPIGRFVLPPDLNAQHLSAWLDDIEALPAQLRAAVAGLDETQLERPYRPEGWTVRQTVNHLADSHLNAYIRTHWALTENHPTIKAYDEKSWAELPDGRQAPIEMSLGLLDSLHRRWIFLLRSLSETDLDRTFVHPEGQKIYVLRQMIGLYSWHGRHHVAHITALRQREGF